MSLREIVSQQQVVRTLQNGLALNKVAHAYCFVGSAGTGKKKAAKELSKALNCTQDSTDACGVCLSCVMIDNGNHPDVVTVTPDGASIKIAQIRQLQQDSGYKVEHGTTKVITIESAELITVQAANSLLRFLEEPWPSVVMILIAENANQLLPTVLSRCQILRFSVKSSEHIAKDLLGEGISPIRAEMISLLNPGLHHASSMYSEEQFALFCQRVIKWGEEIFSGKSFALITIQSEWFQKEFEENKGVLILDILLFWIRDRLRRHLHRRVDPKKSMFSVLEDANTNQFVWDRSCLLSGMEAILQARRQLSRFIQPQSVLEQMVLAIQEENLRGKSDWSSV